MKFFDTKIKYHDVFNSMISILSGRGNSINTKTLPYLYSNMFDLCEIIIGEKISNKFHSECAAIVVMISLYKDVGINKYNNFSEFINAAISRHGQNDTILIPEDDVKKLELMQLFNASK